MYLLRATFTSQNCIKVSNQLQIDLLWHRTLIKAKMNVVRLRLLQLKLTKSQQFRLLQLKLTKSQQFYIYSNWMSDHWMSDQLQGERRKLIARYEALMTKSTDRQTGSKNKPAVVNYWVSSITNLQYNLYFITVTFISSTW